MPSVYTRTIERAIEVAGGARQLAQFLGYPEGTLRDWACGAANPPPEIFLALVDIVAANHLAPNALKNLRR